MSRPIYSLHSCSTAAQAQLRPFLTQPTPEKIGQNKKKPYAHRNRTPYLCLKSKQSNHCARLLTVFSWYQNAFYTRVPKLDEHVLPLVHWLGCGMHRVYLTVGNRSGLTGYRSNRTGPVPVWSGMKPVLIQNLNLNSKK